MSWLCLS